MFLSPVWIERTDCHAFFRAEFPAPGYAGLSLSLAISICAVAFNEYVVPWTNSEYQYVLNVEIRRNLNPGVTDHVVIRDVQGGKIVHLLYARKYDPQTKQLENITVQEFQNEEVTRVENAPIAVWKDGVWYMTNGVIYDLTGDGVDRMMHFESQAIPYAQSPEDIPKENKDLDEMTIRELLLTKKAYAAAHADTTGITMEIYRRFSLPMASFVFAIVGAPLGVQKQRSSSSVGFGISVVIIFLYYAIMTFLEALGKGHLMPAFLAVWLPNMIAFVTGCYLIWRVDR